MINMFVTLVAADAKMVQNPRRCNMEIFFFIFYFIFSVLQFLERKNCVTFNGI